MFLPLSRWRNRWAVFIYDLCSVPVAWLGAFWLRFNLDTIPPDTLYLALSFLPLMMACQLSTFWGFGLYRGVWRFASLPDLTRIIKAIVTGSMLALLTLFFAYRLHGLPRSVMPLYSLLLLMMLGGARFLVRGLKDKQTLLMQGAKRVLIVGAGQAGESLARDLKRHTVEYQPVAFVDDRRNKQGQEIQGLRVQGTTRAIPKLSKKYHIDMIMLAIPSANAAAMRRILALCESNKVPVCTLPSLQDLMTGNVSIKALRDISIEDLLGRETVKTDTQAITAALARQCVWVTGGGGSIGSELCRQILQRQPKQLVIIDNCEYHLFQLEQELMPLKQNTELVFRLLDVCDIKGVSHAITQDKPDVIFHAAAFKHVPLLEPQVRTAVRNNILGTYYVAKAAVQHQVNKFVLVSTDKAVNPSCVMGATKRAAEIVCQILQQQQKTRFVTVRFGNVLGSKGSVVETFRQQLAAGQPLTVTHPEVTRYFMTIPEACQLILQGLATGQAGELLVLDMGEPVKISYMASQMIRLSGKQAEDVPIQYIGLRPGEKLHEVLLHEQEKLLKTAHNKIMKVEPRSVQADLMLDYIKQLTTYVEACDSHILQQVLEKLVPEYTTSRRTAHCPKVALEVPIIS